MHVSLLKKEQMGAFMDLPYIIGYTLGRATPIILVIGIIILIIRRSREKNQRVMAADGVPAPPKRRTSKALIILAGITFVILILFSYAVSTLPAREKVFSREGFSITLTEDFHEKERGGYFVYYESQNVAVLVMKLEISMLAGPGLPADTSLHEYAEAFLFVNGFDAVIEEKDGLLSFELERINSGKRHVNFWVFYESADAFWVVQFVCEAGSGERSRLTEWAGSVIIT
jgi:hypothetical protein